MSVAIYRNDLIKGKMAELGKTTDDFKVHRNTVSNIRNGADVKISTLKSVVEELDLSLVEIFTPKSDDANLKSENQINFGK